MVITFIIKNNDGIILDIFFAFIIFFKKINNKKLVIKLTIIVLKLNGTIFTRNYSISEI